MIRNAMARFMYGRYGTDQLGLFNLCLYLLVWVIQGFTRWWPLSILELALLAVILFRMLSRNLDARRAEIMQMACKSAVKGGDALSESEIDALIGEMLCVLKEQGEDAAFAYVRALLREEKQNPTK